MGGHSIDTPEPIYGLAVIGTCRPGEVRRNADAKVGDTLMLNATPDSQVELRAGAIPLTRGRMGRRNHHIAVRVDSPLSPHAKKAISRFK